MSSLYRRLHGVFFTNTRLPSTRTSLLSCRRYVSSTLELELGLEPPQTKPEESLRTSVKKMLEERDHRTMVDMFKKFSETKWFRGRRVAYSETVRRLAAVKQFSLIEEIMAEQKKYKCIKDERFVVRIISLYGKSGMFDHARKLFDEMPQLKCARTVRSFNALLAACIDSKRFNEVEGIFREVPAKLSIKPNVISYNTFIKAYCEMGSLDSAVSAVDEMESNGLNPDSITFAMLLNGYYQNGRFSEGDHIWESLESKGIVPCIWCYNAKLRGLASQKRMSEAVELFRGLSFKGIRPDKFTFNALIKGFCDDKNLRKAVLWYKQLADYDCVPNFLTFGILIPFLCEMADFDLALELCNEAISKWHTLDAATLQAVVDGLVKESKVEEAKMLVESIQQSNGYYYCELKLPLGE